MRAMKGGLSRKDRTPLVVKASLPRAFLGVGVFLEIGLLFLGSYLLADAILRPLQAGTEMVLAGAVFLALATVLLFYLVWPAKAKSISRRDDSEDCYQETITVYAKAVPEQRETTWLVPKKENLPRPM